MAYEVVWSPTALEDIEAIASYISRDSASYASAVVRKVINSTRHLERFPLVGRIVPELDQNHIREVFAYTYRIVYRVESEMVTVVAVIHGKQMFALPLHRESE